MVVIIRYFGKILLSSMLSSGATHGGKWRGERNASTISTTNYVASVGVTVGVISLKGMALCFLDP